MSVGRRRRHLRPTMAVALGFLGVIAAGTALLAAPWSSASGAGTPLSDALFTATSATCLTGLITVDTATHWSAAGQVTIMALIQLGGLGFMTMASLMALLVGGRMGLRRRLGATAEGRGLDLGDVAWVVRATVLFTLVVELLVALVLTVRFHAGYGYGWGRAAWEGVFHAISGFNNAGFAVAGEAAMHRHWPRPARVEPGRLHHPIRPRQAAHRHPVAGTHAALVDDGAERGDKAAAEARGRFEVKLLRQGDEVRVRVIDRDIFRKRSPGGEARLELVLADLMVAGIALEAAPAAAADSSIALR